MKNTKPLLPLALAAALAAGAPGLVAADWLVLKDGERIETKGPWKIEGSRVLFKNASGALVSLRSSEVDLEASQRANSPAPRKPAPASTVTEGRQAPVMVLDQSNVGRSRALQGADANAAADGAARSRSELHIAGWQETSAGVDGLVFTGTLNNPTDNFAVLVEVTARLLDEEGHETARTTASMKAASVGPQESAEFVVRFPGAFAYGEAVFDLDYKYLRGAESDSPAAANTNNEAAPQNEG